MSIPSSTTTGIMSTDPKVSPLSAYSPTFSLNSTDNFHIPASSPSIPSSSPSLGAPPRPIRRSTPTPPNTSPRTDKTLPPSRSSSLRRKPVPDYLPMPNMNQPIPLPNASLPPTHPFAASIKGASPASLSPTTPGMMKMEDDLFFSPPSKGVRTGPVPPRRPGGSVKSGRGGESMSRGGTQESMRSPASIQSETVEEEVLDHNLGETGEAVAVETPIPATQGQEVNVTLDKALPPVPGSESTLNRQDSSDSGHNPLPLTPRSGTSATPQISTRTHPGLPRQSSSSSTRSSVFGQTKRKDKLRSHESYSKPSTRSKELSPEDISDEEFDVDRIPSKRRLMEAGTLFLRDEEGALIPFSSFFPGSGSPQPNEASTSTTASLPPPKTILFFIRHFWCGQCQDFTFASLSLLDPVQLAQANIRVIVISNGSWKIIKSYKKLFNCPFPIYVDGPRKLYQLLGMTKMTNDFGPMFKGRAAYNQRSAPSQLVHGIGNALFRMPIADPGKLTQLGGEFILSEGFVCDFAHRMTNTSNHMEAPDVVRLAGVAAPTQSDVIGLKFEESQAAELERLQKEEAEWRKGRESELERIRRRKAERRGEVYVRQSNASALSFSMGGGEGEGVNEIDERFRRVMAMQSGGRDEQGGAKGLALGQLAA